jgi:hypothetical protein
MQVPLPHALFLPCCAPRGWLHVCCHYAAVLQRLVMAVGLADSDLSAAGDPQLNLAGLRLIVCRRTALDACGALCLDADADAEDWAAFLSGVDLDYARARAELASAVRRLEAGVAAALGVRMLFTTGAGLMTHAYRRVVGTGAWRTRSSCALYVVHTHMPFPQLRLCPVFAAGHMFQCDHVRINVHASNVPAVCAVLAPQGVS